MTALTRLERMDELLPEMFRRFALSRPFDIDLPADIRLDVSENDKEFLISAEIPGAARDDIRVAVDGRTVSISAELKKDVEERDSKNGRVLLKETARGSVARSFVLSHDVDDKACTAKLDNGILKLRLPKRTSASSRLLNIE